MADFTASCAVQAIDDGPASELVHLLPLGALKGRDGRRFTLDDARGFIARTRARGGDLPIDYEHQSADPIRQKNGTVPAAGWIKELLLRADGVWGRVEWTKTASAMIAAREYRYLSPVITFDRTRRLIRLKGAGLVHEPNLELTALSREEDPLMDEDDTLELRRALGDLSRIATALGLPEDADADAIVAALTDHKAERAAENSAAPDPAQYVPMAVVADLMRDRNEQRATMSARDAERRVEDAMDAGHLTPAMFEWGVALCRQDPDAFDAFLDRSAAPYAHPMERPRAARRKPPVTGELATDDQVAALCRQLDLKPADLK